MGKIQLDWTDYGYRDEHGMHWAIVSEDASRLATRLRGDYRVKLGIDYGYRIAAGVMTIYCEPVWRDAIQEAADRLSIAIVFG
jgi:hypothetical protein